ncbi:unnamed protein product [Cylindrotheca closterium]|uniref:Uncharacterized protein n=1 Tax=Cylindrotheca closterium TaxID=2856 RepID=A0AAD2CTH6_9STRA|nr:unnamed protein product [Cylindrotheca closterium]
MSASVEQEIEQVGEAIARVENEIEEINEKLKNPTISDVDKAYYRQEKSQLRQKESQLRQEKDRLGQKKSQLRQKELLLIERTPVPNAAFDVASIAQELTSIAQALNQELAALRDKDDTVAFSNVTSTVFNEVMTSLDIEQVAAPWQNRPPCPQCDMPFQWGAAKEDNTENREGYMAYLKELGFPDSVRLFDASNAKELLETDLPPTKPRMKGSIDVVVLAAHNPNISGAKHNILMGIELKKDKNQQHDKIRRSK